MDQLSLTTRIVTHFRWVEDTECVDIRAGYPVRENSPEMVDFILPNEARAFNQTRLNLKTGGSELCEEAGSFDKTGKDDEHHDGNDSSQKECDSHVEKPPRLLLEPKKLDRLLFFTSALKLQKCNVEKQDEYERIPNILKNPDKSISEIKYYRLMAHRVEGCRKLITGKENRFQRTRLQNHHTLLEKNPDLLPWLIKQGFNPKPPNYKPLWRPPRVNSKVQARQEWIEKGQRLRIAAAKSAQPPDCTCLYIPACQPYPCAQFNC